MDVDRTLYLRNITPNITESLLYELFLQAGPLEDVAIKGNIAFVTFEDEDSVLYACSLFEGLKLYGNEIIVKPRAGSKFASARIPSVPPFKDFEVRPDSLAPHFNRSHEFSSRSVMGIPPNPLLGGRYPSPLEFTPVTADVRGSNSNLSSASYPLLPLSHSTYPTQNSSVSPFWQQSNLLRSDERIHRSHYSDRSTHSHSGNRERSPFDSNHHSNYHGTSQYSSRGHSSNQYTGNHDFRNTHSHR